ncbi:hypothetical protein Ahy_A01g004363 isoform B [Arachis hypogaea]|uniref:Pentatricopeptide repeat-containing protein n=1 Tax=Arachis hypogaea TaxID=3818 RepID=A0A445EVW7_ARAHY|nr:hypothetical protein Ahy_A01g004363 isoform B [Arachis hypogaea]
MKSCLPLTSLLTHSSRILKSESLPFSNPSPSSSHCRRPSVEPLPPSVARIPSPFVLFLKCPTPALSFRELGPSVVFIFSPSCGRCRPSHQRTLPRIPTSKLPKSLSPRRLLQLLKFEKDPRAAVTLFHSAILRPGYTHSPAVFHHVLRRIAAADPSLLLLPHLPRVIDAIRSHNCKCTEDVPLTAIKAYAKNSKPDEALHLFQNMETLFGCTPGVRSFNTLLNAFVLSNQWDRANRFFAYYETVGVEPNLETYNVLMKVLCKKKQFDKAKRLLGWLWEKGLRPDKFTYGTLINGMVKCGDLCNALEVFDEMPQRGVAADVMCYNMVIDGFFKKGDSLRAKMTWERLLSGDSDVYPNVTSYNIMISGLCKCGRFDECLEIWERMKKNERKHDLFTYSSLIHGLSEGGNLDGAKRVYKDMVGRGIRPDVVTCNAMLNGLCKAGNIEESFQLWEEMKKYGCRNVVSYNIFLNGLLENRKVEEALSQWDALLETAWGTDSKSYGIVVHGLCKNGYLNKALRLLEEAVQKGGDVDAFAFSSMINALCKEGRLDEAAEVVSVMDKNGCKLNPHVCNAIIDGFIKHSELDNAIQFFREMSIKGCSPTVVSYNILLNGLCKAERFIETYDYIKEMLEKGWKPDIITYSTLIDGLCQSKMIDTVLRLWNLFLDSGFKPDIRMYNIVIHRLCSSEKMEHAMQLYSMMRQKNCINLVTYNTIMEGFYKVGDCEKASNIWANIFEDGLQPDIISYNITLKGHCSWGRLTEAIRLLDHALECVKATRIAKRTATFLQSVEDETAIALTIPMPNKPMKKRLGIRLVRLAAAEDGTSFVLVEPCAVDIILAIGRTERRMNGFEGNHPLVTVKY